MRVDPFGGCMGSIQAKERHVEGTSYLSHDVQFAYVFKVPGLKEKKVGGETKAFAYG